MPLGIRHRICAASKPNRDKDHISGCRSLFQVTTEASKLAPVTNRARLHIQARLLVGMRVQKTRHMAGWFQLGSLGMTERATIRRINLVVANQAIGHLRHVGLTHRIRLLKPAMTSHARIRGIQQRPDLGRITPKISPLIDRPSNHRPDIAELQVLSVTEFLKRRRSLREQARGARRQDAGGSKPDPPQIFPERHLPPAACVLPPTRGT